MTWWLAVGSCFDSPVLVFQRRPEGERVSRESFDQNWNMKICLAAFFFFQMLSSVERDDHLINDG